MSVRSGPTSNVPRPEPQEPSSVGETVALVAGASGAIGRAITWSLADAGHNVIAIGRDPDRLDSVAAQRPEMIAAVPVDLCGEDASSVLEGRLAERGRLDVLVLGTGIYRRSDAPDVLGQQFRANVQGPYALLRASLPFLLTARGQVVFLNSTQGLSASPGLGQYAATQHALRAVADSFRDEVNASGIRVASLFLGRTATERQRDIFALEGRDYTPERLIQPGDVAEIVLALTRLPRTAEVTNLTLRPMLKS